MYTLKQANKILKYNNTSYLRKLIANEKVKATKFGTTWVITKKELNRLKKRRGL